MHLTDHFTITSALVARSATSAARDIIADLINVTRADTSELVDAVATGILTPDAMAAQPPIWRGQATYSGGKYRHLPLAEMVMAANWAAIAPDDTVPSSYRLGRIPTVIPKVGVGMRYALTYVSVLQCLWEERLAMLNKRIAKQTLVDEPLSVDKITPITERAAALRMGTSILTALLTETYGVPVFSGTARERAEFYLRHMHEAGLDLPIDLRGASFAANAPRSDFQAYVAGIRNRFLKEYIMINCHDS